MQLTFSTCSQFVWLVARSTIFQFNAISTNTYINSLHQKTVLIFDFNYSLVYNFIKILFRHIFIALDKNI